MRKAWQKRHGTLYGMCYRLPYLRRNVRPAGYGLKTTNMPLRLRRAYLILSSYCAVEPVNDPNHAVASWSIGLTLVRCVPPWIGVSVSFVAPAAINLLYVVCDVIKGTSVSAVP